MIYGYLADTALAPLSPNNTTYQSYSGYGTGVGQVTERVLSVLNTDIKAATAADPAPGLIIDPRTNSSNMRRTECFDGPGISSQMRASGVMSIHYDRYLAYQEVEDSPDLAGNYIDRVTKQDELKILFTVIETITMSHIYDTNSQIWEYRTQSWLNGRLSSYSINNIGSYGYIKDTLIISEQTTVSKTAKVRNVTSGSSTVVDTLGDDPLAAVANVYFPSVISFSFKFSELDGPTAFKLYLDPESILNNYDVSTITHVVMPMAPEDLCNPTKIEDLSALGVLDLSSAYVANMISGSYDEDDTSTHDFVFNSDILKGTNYTGSVARSVGYLEGGEHNVKFACIYKGSVPTTFSCLKAIYNALLNRLTSNTTGCNKTKDEAEGLIRYVFPGILSVEQYTIIPFYDSMVTSNVSNSYTYARNVFSLAYINRLMRNAQSNVANSDAYTTMITIPGYDMHAIAIAAEPPSSVIAPVVSEHGLDSNDDFSSYQALSSVDTRWNTMTTESQLLSEYLSAIVGAEVTGTAIAGSKKLSYTPESVKLGGVNYASIVFTIGTATFYVMRKSAYTKFIGNIGA